MKIGIFTQPLKNNYGGILQNYALQQVLINLGYDPVTIDYCPHRSFMRYLLSQCKTLLFLFIPYKRRPFSKYLKVGEQNPIMSEFVSNHILTTEKLKKITQKIVRKNKFQVVISGSDQVWRPRYNVNLKYSFLSFVKSSSVKKIAYAASFGVDEWEFSGAQTVMCSKLAKRFNAISVRETSAVSLCKRYLKVDAIEVLDPTLLLNKERYSSLCEKIPVETSHFMLVYILDLTDAKRIFIETLANEKNLDLRFCSAESNVTISVEQWLSNFRDADYVVTDSFHGTVFSIIFRKQFLSIANSRRGADRFVSLLTKFNLQNRMIVEDSFVISDDTPIPWDEVSKELNEERKKSLRFLTSNILA